MATLAAHPSRISVDSMTELTAENRPRQTDYAAAYAAMHDLYGPSGQGRLVPKSKKPPKKNRQIPKSTLPVQSSPPASQADGSGSSRGALREGLAKAAKRVKSIRRNLFRVINSIGGPRIKRLAEDCKEGCAARQGRKDELCHYCDFCEPRSSHSSHMLNTAPYQLHVSGILLQRLSTHVDTTQCVAMIQRLLRYRPTATYGLQDLEKPAKVVSFKPSASCNLRLRYGEAVAGAASCSYAHVSRESNPVRR
ncbi:hypothetical protein DFH06DRAFT_1426671 [Mycena polygramma]|nr:hypothetical protein DFH06DRAFT_1426671 [Mycena polygramma]